MFRTLPFSEIQYLATVTHKSLPLTSEICCHLFGLSLNQIHLSDYPDIYPEFLQHEVLETIIQNHDF